MVIGIKLFVTRNIYGPITISINHGTTNLCTVIKVNRDCIARRSFTTDGPVAFDWCFNGWTRNFFGFNCGMSLITFITILIRLNGVNIIARIQAGMAWYVYGPSSISPNHGAANY